MKIRKKPIIISVLSLVLCLSLVIGITYRMPLMAHAVEVTANMSRMTSAGGGVSQLQDNVYAFNDGAQIQIVGWYGAWADYNKPWEMASDEWWNSAVSTYNATSGKWKTDNYMRWQNGKDQHNFLSYWPANLADPNSDLTNVPVTITGSPEDDILLARWSGKHPNDNVLDLEFDHLMARFDVHLIFRDEYEGATDISIETKLQNSATVDLLAGTITATSGNYVKMQESTYPDENYDWSGTCITVPHDFAGPLLTIKFTTPDGEKSIDYTQPETAILKFRSNERITLYLEVGKDKVELIDVSVAPWNQEYINAGEAEELQ